MTKRKLKTGANRVLMFALGIWHGLLRACQLLRTCTVIFFHCLKQNRLVLKHLPVGIAYHFRKDFGTERKGSVCPSQPSAHLQQRIRCFDRDLELF